MRRIALAAVLSLAALATQAVPALAGGAQPTNTIVIDDSNPATVTITATGFSLGLFNNDSPSNGIILAPGQIGPVSITLPDVSGTSSAPFYLLVAQLEGVASNLPTEDTEIAFYLGNPNNVTSSVSGFTAGSDSNVAQIEVEFHPYTGASFPHLPGTVLQDGHQEFFSLLNGALTVTFISEAPERAPIPEPTTLAVLGFGLAGLGLARRRRAA